MGVRRASLNSFGFGGSNAHVILDDAYHYLSSHGMTGRHKTVPYPSKQSSNSDTAAYLIEDHRKENGILVDFSEQGKPLPRLLVLSVADEEGMKRLSNLYEDYFRNNPHLNDFADFRNLVYTLAVRRTSFTWRSYLVASDLVGLQALGSKISKVVRSSEKRGVIFIFTGQGAQYAQMGQELLAYPTFRGSLLQSEAALHALVANGRYWVNNPTSLWRLPANAKP